MAFLMDSLSKPPFKRILISQIARNPNQPRYVFDAEGIKALADSIARYGVITPLTVRRAEEGYQLISGERRLRAAKMAGLDRVPCYIIEAEEEQSSVMALVENLQRQDLDFFEEAQGLLRLTQLFGLTQQQAAEKVGKTQSAVANKLRLLRLHPDTMTMIRAHGLTERHARALLRLEDEGEQKAAAGHIVKGKLNVEQTDNYIDRLLARKEQTAKPTRKIVLRDVRIFLNSINKATALMKQAGVAASMEQSREGDEITVTIRIADPVH